MASVAFTSGIPPAVAFLHQQYQDQGSDQDLGCARLALSNGTSCTYPSLPAGAYRGPDAAATRQGFVRGVGALCRAA